MIEILLALAAIAARTLAETTPAGLNRVHFVNSGAEATEAAITLARALPAIPAVLSSLTQLAGGTGGGSFEISIKAGTETFCSTVHTM